MKKKVRWLAIANCVVVLVRTLTLSNNQRVTGNEYVNVSVRILKYYLAIWEILIQEHMYF